MSEALGMMEPYAPILDGIRRFCAEREKVFSQCREFVNWVNGLTAQYKLDLIPITLEIDSIAKAFESESAERSTRKPVDPLEAFCASVVKKN